MLTLFGGLLGLLTSALPTLLGLWQGRQDKKHELKILEVQAGLARLGHAQRLEEIQVQADVAESAALYRPQARSGVRWVDGLNASVRPVVTYLFLAAYLSVKVATYHLMTMVILDTTMAQAVTRLWNADDMAIFMAVLGYWFGSRSLAKFREGRG